LIHEPHNDSAQEKINYVANKLSLSLSQAGHWKQKGVAKAKNFDKVALWQPLAIVGNAGSNTS
jgi:hypothetical protein